ncbi:hypothetical protein FQZ97_964200 [compost metagenome]
MGWTERYVVVEAVVVRRRGLLAGCRPALGTIAWLLLRLLAWCGVLRRPVDDLRTLGQVDLGDVALAAVLLVLAGLQLAHGEQAGALAQPLTEKLGSRSEGDAAHPLGLLDALAGLLALVAVIDADVEIGHRPAVRQIAQLNVLAQAANAFPAVQVAHAAITRSMRASMISWKVLTRSASLRI